ncbi:hypothetical protein EV175_001712 [Coemansia sp. RSA 1933]|nr:hypothetical protein EV175_001712 [Coemansia sp. RSA 1933]
MTAGFGNLADIATPSKSRSKSPIASQSSKIEYRTLEELQQRTDARMKEVFVDMSTNVQVSSLAELVSKKLPLNEKEQLARDARLGLDLAFSRLEHIKRETSIEETRCSVLHKDIDRLSSSIDQRRKIVECFSKIRRAIKAVYDKAGDTTITSIESAMDDMADLFSSFHDLYDMAQKIEASKNGFDVWHELHLEQVVTSVMFDCLKRVLVIWKPAEHMQILAVVLAPLRMFISTNDGNIQAETMTPFESLLNRVLVPCLKRFIFTEWDPLSDNLGGILDILPQTTVFSISPDIGSVLQRFVDEINTRVVMNGYNRSLAENGGSDSAQMSLAPLRMDRIVIPWLPFILERGELLSSIRRKLCAVLSLWTPSTKSNKDVVALMAPWLQVLQGKDLYKLGSKVAGRLEYMLESEFQFNAQKQVIWPFKALLEWHDVLPFDVWFSIAKRGVISKFLDYLWAWLQHPNSNYAEIANWYWQWRHMYPDDIFVHPDVQSEFRTALVYMAHSMVQK